MDAYEGLPVGDDGKVIFGDGKKWDIQIRLGRERERELAKVFRDAKFDGMTVELKSESYLWERTGNICIEYARGGSKSGLATTEADIWVHELMRDGKTLAWIMIPIARMKELARAAYRADLKASGGDGGLSKVVLVPLKDILK